MKAISSNFGQTTSLWYLPCLQLHPPFSPCQQHHLAFISEFNVQMLYLPGLQNVIADFLSRPASVPGNATAVAEAAPVDFEEMAAKQNHCLETRCLLGGTSLTIALKKVGNQRLVGDVSTGIFHPVAPTKYQKDIFSICTISHIQRGSSLGSGFF